MEKPNTTFIHSSLRTYVLYYNKLLIVDVHAIANITFYLISLVLEVKKNPFLGSKYYIGLQISITKSSS